MALLQIPLAQVPDQQFTIELNLEVFTFRIVRNERTERYMLSVYTEAMEPIVTSVPMVEGFPFLDRFKDERLPKGGLFLWDSTGKHREATDETLGVEHLLLYREAE